MTRFDAATANERRELFADAIRAHDERSSAFLTIETERDDSEESEGATESEPPIPWVQFADGVLNLDCTDTEFDGLKSLLSSVSQFTIEELESPENVDGTNVRISARADPERVAEFVDRIFLDVYERPEDYRAWVTAV